MHNTGICNGPGGEENNLIGGDADAKENTTNGPSYVRIRPIELEIEDYTMQQKIQKIAAPLAESELKC